MRLRHEDAPNLANCTATLENPDGTERSAAENLIWDHTTDGIVITVSCGYLRLGQAVTLRWEIDHAAT